MQHHRAVPRGLFVAISLTAALVAGCGSGSKGSSSTTPASSTPASSSAAASAPSASGKVDIAQFKFAPASVTVKVGATVTFTNSDSTEHTATVDSGSAFDTGALTQGKSKTVTFSKAGTYAYHCAFHPFMHGTVIVQ